MISSGLDTDYDLTTTESSRSVLLEVMTILGEYRESLVLIGGWAPYFLLSQKSVVTSTVSLGVQSAPFRHIGSVDIDIAVNPKKITGDKYKTIVRLLQERGYRPDDEIKYRLNRIISGLPAPIGIDFLTTQPALGKGRSRRHRKVQENLPARATAHLEMAFQWNESLRLEAELPEGCGRNSTMLQLASLPAMVGLKGLALGERYKEKDAYDLYALARYYDSGIQEVINLLKPHVQDIGLKKGLENVREKFKSDKDAGPAWVANFFSAASADEKAHIIQDAFQTIDKVLKGCGF